jgi:hypothetical protein
MATLVKDKWESLILGPAVPLPSQWRLGEGSLV